MMAFRTERFVSEDNCLVELPQEPPHEQAYNALSLTYEQVLKVLDEELEKTRLYKQIWQEAEAIFRANPSKYTNQEIRRIPDECHIAIIAYTLDTTYRGRKLYEDFNEKCRNLKNNNGSWSRFCYKSFYWFLAHSLNGIRSLPSLRNKSYRGIVCHYYPDSFSCDRPVFFNQFTSCSTDPRIAEMFSGSIGTIIEFPTNVTAAIGISNYSQFPQENEILIFPWNIFKVKRIDRKGPVHRIVLQKTRRQEFRILAQDFEDLVEDNLPSSSSSSSSSEDEDDY